MAGQHDCQWHRGRDSLNVPAPRRPRSSEKDHASDTGNHKGVHLPEVSEDLRDFFEEVGLFGFLGRGAPFHVDGKPTCDFVLVDWYTEMLRRGD